MTVWFVHLYSTHEILNLNWKILQEKFINENGVKCNKYIFNKLTKIIFGN